MRKPCSRRQFLLSALTLPAMSLARAAPQQHVAIIGAGVAGLACADALVKAGLRVSLFEASNRVGGRCWTVRSGDVVGDTITDKHGSPQTCHWPAGEQLDAGAWRVLPSHRRVLALIERLGLRTAPLRSNGNNIDGAMYLPSGMDTIPRALAAELTTRWPDKFALHLQSPVAHIDVDSAHRTTLYDAHNRRITSADLAIIALPAAQWSRLSITGSALAWPARKPLTHADAIKIAGLSQMPLTSGFSSHLIAPGLQLITPPTGRVLTLYGNSQALSDLLQGPRAEQIQKVHARLRTHLLSIEEHSALVVQWSRIPHQGAAATRIDDERWAAQLRAGSPPLFFASDSLSEDNGWQEGALESAERAVAGLFSHLNAPLSPSYQR
jgi:monoamine oxidase